MTKRRQQTMKEVVYNVITCTRFVFGVCALLSAFCLWLWDTRKQDDWGYPRFKMRWL